MANRSRTKLHLFLLAVALVGIPAKCLAQDEFLDHSCSIYAGGGWVPLTGEDSKSLKASWNNFSVGGGFRVTSAPKPGHRWSAFIDVNFTFDQSRAYQASVQEAKTLNPTNIGLLEATGAKAKFYALTLDPTFRFPEHRVKAVNVGVYLFGGFGWLRRNVEFTGLSGEGALLQPGGPVVFGNGGDSGAFDAGGGVNVRLPKHAGGFMLYLEARVIHGLTINSATTLVPVSAGVRW